MSPTTAMHDTEPTSATPPAASGVSWALDIAAALARFGLALMWIYSGYTKIGAHLDVTKSIEAYQIFTPYSSDLLARAIGPLELAGGLVLLLGIKLRWAGGVSIFVLVLFILGLWSAYSRGLEIDCGCFDPGAGASDPNDLLKAIWRDVALIAVTTFMLWRPFKKLAIYP